MKCEKYSWLILILGKKEVSWKQNSKYRLHVVLKKRQTEFPAGNSKTTYKIASWGLGAMHPSKVVDQGNYFFWKGNHLFTPSNGVNYKEGIFLRIIGKKNLNANGGLHFQLSIFFVQISYFIDIFPDLFFFSFSPIIIIMSNIWKLLKEISIKIWLRLLRVFLFLIFMAVCLVA